MHLFFNLAHQGILVKLVEASNRSTYGVGQGEVDVVLLPGHLLDPQLPNLRWTTAQCVFCKVYFSAQPNKLRPILKFRKYFPVEHIFVPACSSARKIHFFKF